MKRLISYRIVPYFMLLPTIAILAFVVIYPMVFSFWISLHRLYLGKPLAFPFVGLRNYSLVLLRDPVFRTSLTNTLTLAVLCIPLELALGISLAILLSREDIRGKGVFGSLIVMPVVLTPIVSGVLWKFQFHPSYGLVNFLLGLLGIGKAEWLAEPRTALLSIATVSVWQWFPFMFLVLYAGLLSLPREPLEAAKVDGASGWQLFRFVVLPLVSPIIGIALLIRTMDLIKLFDIVYVLTRGGPGDATEVLTLYNFRVGLNYFDMGKAAAISWIIAALVTVLSQFYLKISRTIQF